MTEHFSLLGYESRDRITGFAGVVTSISFDLYGCVMGLVTPKGLNEKGELSESRWFDTKRLVATSEAPLMAVPEFVSVAGPEIKPGFASPPQQ